MNSPTLAYVVGARPNFVKMAPVIHELKARLAWARHVVIHTGQHYDREMSAIFFEHLELAEPDYSLGVGSGSHGMQTGRALERIEEVLTREAPAMVIVPGDVNSTLAGALAAAKLGIPVAHVEAGLRSFDRTMPEEINRVLTDELSRWCFIHSPEAEDNLLREGIESERIFFAGNTMIDTLVRMRPLVERSDVIERLGLRPGEYVLVTLHRPNLVDTSLFGEVLAALERLSSWLPVVFPMHPRTRKRLAAHSVAPTEHLHLVDPVGYIDFLALESAAAAVVTDSGGVQEETTFLKVPCFTLRDNTDRPVTIQHGTNRVIGLRPDMLDQVPAFVEEAAIPLTAPPAWDGYAALRVADVLCSALTEEARTRPSVAIEWTGAPPAVAQNR
jgi:UDP-N-acetylglucosamine 2-epimerase (non-hydrolysing)